MPFQNLIHRCALVCALAVVLHPGSGLHAQEFNPQVSVIAPRISNAEPRVLKSLESAIREFYASRRFTNFNYAPHERIEINLLLTINDMPTQDRYECNLQVIYSRPVFGADYNSPIIDLVDNQVGFNFLENTVIEFAPERYINNLSSILGFYAYFILGMDGDSFSPLGGTEFYNLAQQVANNAQGGSESGWNPGENNRNRYWLVDNQLQSVFRPFRELLYTYHRQGMDTMTEDAVAARRAMAEAIERLKPVHQSQPASYNLQVFFNAKYNELVELFKPADTQQKAKLFNTLQIIDPGHISQYQAMMRGG